MQNNITTLIFVSSKSGFSFKPLTYFMSFKILSSHVCNMLLQYVISSFRGYIDLKILNSGLPLGESDLQQDPREEHQRDFCCN